MDEITNGQAEPRAKHLRSPESVMRSTDSSGTADLTRHHGQGNGLRVHGIYFGVVSLVALVLVIGAIVLASRMM